MNDKFVPSTKFMNPKRDGLNNKTSILSGMSNKFVESKLCSFPTFSTMLMILAC